MPHYIWQQKNWPAFRWDAQALLTAVGKCRIQQGRLLGIVSSLGITQSKEAQAELVVEEAVTTSAIEGENLSPISVRSSVARQLGLPTAGMPIDRSAEGLVSVLLDAAGNFDAPLAADRLHSWHAALFPTGYSGLHKIRVGRWRGDAPMRIVSGPIGREHVHYEAPPAQQVSGEMKRFIAWWNEDRKSMDGIIFAAVAHFWFVVIHPYEDGNGRIARALTDMAIARDDRQPFRYYSLSSQIMKDRKEYYAALELCSTGNGDITPWLAWFFDCFERAIDNSEEKLAIVLDKARFWQKHAHEPLSERQRKVINRLLDSGRGRFEGGLTTRKYVALAGVSRATAFREIEQLLDLGILVRRSGGGRSVSYELKWEDA